ncbi:hypothetical protein [Planctomicrobium sp. SH527]|uniref:hypothetical protein n=1 Tax=Planctomicrobium sp. SH527 TaxID=3448123 RepID=UPI003F5BE626
MNAFFTREFYSQVRCPGAILAPDVALCLNVSGAIPAPNCDVVLILRSDGESQFDRRGHDPAAGLGWLSYLAYLRKAAAVRTIVTDCLHFTIAGQICQRRVILLPNAYRKNQGVFEAWLEKLEFEWPADLKEVGRLCSKLKLSL